MTKEDRGHYAKKNSPNFVARPEIVEEINKHTSKNGLPCAAAFKVAKETGVDAKEVGATLDSLEITITNCQLGLFGYKEGKSSALKAMETIPEDLEEAVRTSTVDGKITCKDAWGVSAKLGKGKMEVSSACETMEVKITTCQLGAFG
jgi:hypothetical protein